MCEYDRLQMNSTLYDMGFPNTLSHTRKKSVLQVIVVMVIVMVMVVALHIVMILNNFWGVLIVWRSTIVIK